MAIEQPIIRGPYGTAVDPQIPELESAGASDASTAIPAETTPITLDDAAYSAVSERSAQARQARDRVATAWEAPALYAAGTAVRTWATTRILDRINRPSFDDEASWGAQEKHEFLQQIPMQLDEDELEWVLDVGKGSKSMPWAIDYLKSQRRAKAVIGQRPGLGIAVAMLDPVWLAMPGALRVGRLAGSAGRVASAVAMGGITAGVTAAQEGPVSDQELLLNVTLASAVGGLFYRAPGVKGVGDGNFPTEEINDVVQATAAGQPLRRLVSPETWEDVHVPAGKAMQPVEETVPASRRMVSDEVWEDIPASTRTVMREVDVPEQTTHRKVADAVWEDVPPELAPGVVHTDPAATVQAVDLELQKQSGTRGLGQRLMWNTHKTLGQFGAVGQRVADLLLDNNANFSRHSVESHREAILGDLRVPLHEYLDLMRSAMAEQGAGLPRMLNPFTARQAYTVQRRIEREVQREMFRREQLTLRGAPIEHVGVPKYVKDMADKLDALHKRALAEMKAAGVGGAENVLERAGYLSRRWSSAAMDDVLDRLQALGLTRDAARAHLNDLLSLSLQRANGWDKKLSDQVGSAIIQRALNKGHFEDTSFNAGVTTGTMGDLREIMKDGGMSHADIERALERLRVETDEAGKAGYMKHRMDLDYDVSINVGDQSVSVMDLIDSSVSTSVDQYIKRVSTNSAFARNGIRRRSDIESLRREFLDGVPDETTRGEAAQLFDSVVAHFNGDPAGQSLNKNWRLVGAYGRMISLAWSGLWQMTEYANIMGTYTLRGTVRYAMQEIPGFKQLLTKPGRDEARALNNVLAEHSVQSLRLRPYMTRYADGFEMPTGSALQLSAQVGGELVPFANGMKFVHHNQAKVVGNLILDRLEQAGKGNKKAREALASYGLESPVMDRIAAEIKAKGLVVDNWDNKVWEAARPAFAKMMDSAVLKGRLGDVPAFAAFDTLGKFLFTYRTFVLTSHNKILAGNLARNGAGAVGLILMYQLPLALLAVQAQSVIKGEGTLSEEDMVKRALGQLGGLGLFSEPLKWATGESNEWGSTGTIPIDRTIKLGQNILNGDAQGALSNSMTMIPVWAATPFSRSVANAIKE